MEWRIDPAATSAAVRQSPTRRQCEVLMMHGGFTKAQVRKMSRADAATHLSSMFASWKAANSMRAFHRFGDLDMHWGDIDEMLEWCGGPEF